MCRDQVRIPVCIQGFRAIWNFPELVRKHRIGASDAFHRLDFLKSSYTGFEPLSIVIIECKRAASICILLVRHFVKIPLT